MQLGDQLYIIILVFASLVQGSLLIFTNLQMDMRKQTKLYRWLIICSIAIAFSDIFARIVSLTNDHGSMFETLSYMFNGLYFQLHICLTGIWFFYALNEIDITWKEKPLPVVLSLLPLLLAMVLVMTSSISGWVFFVDDQNVYHRGDLFLVLPVMCMIYLLVPSVISLMKIRLREYFIHRTKLITIAVFAVIVLPFVVLQIVFGPDFPLFCVGYTLAILMLHINRQNLRITIDELTGVSNRSQAMRYLSYKMNAPAEAGKQIKSLYVMMVDIDKFKQINDNFGHVEGDEALKRTSNVLKRSVPRSYFIGRYGGDEFIIIGDALRETEIQDVCQKIYDNLELANQEAMAPYHLSLSIGYKVRNGQITSIPEFIKQADLNLYRVKKNRAE